MRRWKLATLLDRHTHTPIVSSLLYLELGKKIIFILYIKKKNTENSLALAAPLYTAWHQHLSIVNTTLRNVGGSHFVLRHSTKTHLRTSFGMFEVQKKTKTTKQQHYPTAKTCGLELSNSFPCVPASYSFTMSLAEHSASPWSLVALQV